MERTPAQADRMLSDWELWACAVEAVRIHGERAPTVVAGQIKRLT